MGGGKKIYNIAVYIFFTNYNIYSFCEKLRTHIETPRIPTTINAKRFG